MFSTVLGYMEQLKAPSPPYLPSTWAFDSLKAALQNQWAESLIMMLALCPQLTSDYSFVNMWAWADEYGLIWAWENDMVWIQQTFPEPVYWAPVGDWNQADHPVDYLRKFRCIV